ncbi:MAG: usherin-like [Phycisphaerales bacterium]|nr:usherin-like [Phycisphaerales bacterium]
MLLSLLIPILFGRPPAVPSVRLLRAKAGDEHTLMVSDGPEEGEPTVSAPTGYRIRRDGVLVYDGPDPKFLDDDLTNGVTYSYTVSAYNQYGESAESEPVEVTPGAPGGIVVRPASPTVVRPVQS